MTFLANKKAARDSTGNAFISHSCYPLIRTSKFSGIVPVADPAEANEITIGFPKAMPAA